MINTRLTRKALTISQVTDLMGKVYVRRGHMDRRTNSVMRALLSDLQNREPTAPKLGNVE
jgi:hypothetical protein